MCFGMCFGMCFAMCSAWWIDKTTQPSVFGPVLRTPNETVMRNPGSKEEDRSVRKYVRTDDAAARVRNRFR